jgi:transcriptional regulator with XRE-family HTH domain
VGLFYGAMPRSVKHLRTVQCAVTLKRDINVQLKRFGGNVRRERMAAKITQQRLAEMADVNIRTLQSIEAGKLNFPFSALFESLRFHSFLIKPERRHPERMRQRWMLQPEEPRGKNETVIFSKTRLFLILHA